MPTPRSCPATSAGWPRSIGISKIADAGLRRSATVACASRSTATGADGTPSHAPGVASHRQPAARLLSRSRRRRHARRGSAGLALAHVRRQYHILGGLSGCKRNRCEVDADLVLLAAGRGVEVRAVASMSRGAAAFANQSANKANDLDAAVAVHDCRGAGGGAVVPVPRKPSFVPDPDSGIAWPPATTLSTVPAGRAWPRKLSPS